MGDAGVDFDALQIEDDQLRPEHVFTFSRPTAGYMCPLSANVYGIDFLSFRIRDMASGRELFRVARDPSQPAPDLSQIPPGDPMEDAVRCISYDFGESFLGLNAIGTELEFAVGPEPVDNFRMIERHYFRDQLIKSFDFEFGFCIPNSQNAWEAIYDMPPLPPDLMEAMIANPWQTESDSFYFVGDTLVMHNQAKYAYSPGM